MFGDFEFVFGTMLVISIDLKLNLYMNCVAKNFENESPKTSEMVPKMRPEASEEVVWESRLGIYRSVFSRRGSQSALEVHFGFPGTNFGSPFASLFGSEIGFRGHCFFNDLLDLDFNGFGKDFGRIWVGFGNLFGTTFLRH